MSFSDLTEGLNNQWISYISQDTKGFIWVGTQDGLHRYDGYTFELFRNSPEAPESIAGNWIRAIVPDSNENIWVGTYGGGLTKFSPKEMRFTNFALDKSNESLGKTVFKAITVNETHLLSSTEEGFQIYDINSNERRSLNFGIFGSSIAANGKELWLSENQSLYRQNLDANNSTLVHTFDSFIYILEYIPSIGLLVGLEDKLILFRQGKIEKQISLDEALFNITPNSSGNYYLASEKSLFEFNVDAFELRRLPSEIDTANKEIKTIFEDRQGNLWVGTDKGLLKEKEV